jgi:hypothetical protein
MGLNLPLRTETFTAPEDQSWLGSAHGTSEADPITLNADTFLTLFPDGIVPSGVVVGIVTATGLYVPYTDAATNGAGSDVARGHLLTTVNLGGTTAGTVDRVACALFWHGEVVEANLPTGHGLTAAAKVDLNQIRYV